MRDKSDNQNDKKRSKAESSTNSTPQDDSFERVKIKLDPCYEEEFIKSDNLEEAHWIEHHKGSFQSQSDLKAFDLFIPLHENIQQDQKQIEPVTQLIYVTRTHSQINQFLNEFKSTDFGKMFNIKGVSLRTVSFASRKQMCINEKVQEVFQQDGLEAMNESCKELRRNQFKNEQDKMKNRIHQNLKERETCCFMPCTKNEEDFELKQYKDAIYQQPRDIEEMGEIGKTLKVCPYYGSREAAKGAQLIVMTYDLLLNANARKAIGVQLHNSVIIIDEAHNIVDKILQINSVVITASQVETALNLIDIYLNMAESVQEFKHRETFKELETILYGIDIFCNKNISKEKLKPMTPVEFMRNCGGEIDRFILLKLDEWLEDDKFDWQAEREPENQKGSEEKGKGKSKEKEKRLQSHARSVKSAIRSIQAFLLLLTDPDLESRIHLPNPGAKPDTEEKWSIKYQLLDPAIIFQVIVDQARCVILAGGTMKPLTDFTHQLFPQLERDRFVHHEYPHIVPKENIMGAKVYNSINGKRLKYIFDDRAKKDTLVELTEILIEFSKVIPHGMVIFVSSYVYLNQIKKFWQDSPDQYNRLKEHKTIFFEPQNSFEVDEVMDKYKKAIEQKNGALLLAVVNAKLSEGINFKDKIGRGVIVIGLPYAYKEDPELVQRQEFVKRLYERLESEGKDVLSGSDPREELYVNSCMKSINQSIGRVIRHQNDYAAIILLDSRYDQKKHEKKLPSWILESTKAYSRFDELINDLEIFFQTRSDQQRP